jgi:hypothetical protein
MVSVFATWRLTENGTPGFDKNGTGSATEKRRFCAECRKMQHNLSTFATLAARFQRFLYRVISTRCCGC